MNIIEWIKNRYAPAGPLPAGVYHYQTPNDAASQYRIHLRIEPDGQGILILNASTVLHLNQTAAEFASYLVQQKTTEDVSRIVSGRYKVGQGQALQDYSEFLKKIETLVQTTDLDPITYYNFDRLDPYSANLSAPYRLDCAVTYKVNKKSTAADAPTERVKEELGLEQWNQILDTAWKAGIPHVVFTGGEPLLRPDLPEMIAHAEALGMVAGVLTDGLKLTDKTYFDRLLNNGLDHIMIVLDTEDKNAWDAVQVAMAADISVTIHLTFTPNNIADASRFLDRLEKMDVKSLSLSSTSRDMKEALSRVQQEAASRGFSLVWDIPVPYSHFHPVAMEMTDEDHPVDGAGRAWMYVEPDGDVLPGQGINRVLGNILNDSWDIIWSKHS